MNLDLVITQLRTYCDEVGGRVAGAANQFEGVANTTNLDLPAMYVYPLGSAAHEPQGMGASLRQIVTERIGICVIFDNSADRRGQDAADLIRTMRSAMFKAILNYRINPTHASRAIYFVGDKDVSMDRARLQWEFEFAIDETITYMDGFLIPTTPLREADVTIGGAQAEPMTVQKVFFNTP